MGLQTIQANTHVLIRPFPFDVGQPRRHHSYDQGAYVHSPILIIEDDPSIRNIVSEVLEFEGYQVETCGDGAAGLLCVARINPSLIILDMRLPIMNGWAFTRALRATGNHTPILVMTAAQDAKRWAEEINAEGYVGKPFDIDELLTAVAELL